MTSRDLYRLNAGVAEKAIEGGDLGARAAFGAVGENYSLLGPRERDEESGGRLHLVLLPLAILLAVRLVPPQLMAEFRAEADSRAERPVSRVAAVFIVILWIAAAALLLWLWWPWPTLG